MAVLLAAQSASAQWVERRRDQYPTEPGYLIVPAPYSLPGIGEGIFVIGAFANMFRTPTDAYAYWITGDAEGWGTGVEEIHLVDRLLLLEIWREQIDVAQVNQYPSRGMDTSGSDYQLVDARNIVSWGTTLTLALMDRHLEFFYDYETQVVDVVSFRDRDGKIIRDLDEPIEVDSEAHAVGVVADDTDDRWDPRRGQRAVLWTSWQPPQDSDSVNYYRVNAVFDVYVPVGRQSTWVIDLFHSNAVVTERGETDRDVLVREVCPVPDPACEESSEAQDYVTNARAGNANGAAESLGGRERLRAYPDGRFEGAYAQYIGTELRINFTEELTPFDYFFWKDVRTNLQLALIAETGTVSETSGGLWERNRSDVGVGFRMLTAGGGVYRADYVTGDEGPQITIIVNYPW